MINGRRTNMEMRYSAEKRDIPVWLLVRCFWCQLSVLHRYIVEVNGCTYCPLYDSCFSGTQGNQLVTPNSFAILCIRKTPDLSIFQAMIHLGLNTSWCCVVFTSNSCCSAVREPIVIFFYVLYNLRFKIALVFDL